MWQRPQLEYLFSFSTFKYKYINEWICSNQSVVPNDDSRLLAIMLCWQWRHQELWEQKCNRRKLPKCNRRKLPKCNRRKLPAEEVCCMILYRCTLDFQVVCSEVVKNENEILINFRTVYLNVCPFSLSFDPITHLVHLFSFIFYRFTIINSKQFRSLQSRKHSISSCQYLT